jgi:L-rhamnose-H+ transport protein
VSNLKKEARAKQRQTLLGIGVCIFSGGCSCMLNLCLSYGTDIVITAERYGVSEMNANNIIFLIGLTAGFVLNALYCVVLLFWNHTWNNFGRKGIPLLRCWALSALMGIIWMSSVNIYGMGAAIMGSLGDIVGWPLFIILVIASSQVTGIFINKEWAQANRSDMVILAIGLSVLVAALCAVTVGNALLL